MHYHYQDIMQNILHWENYYYYMYEFFNLIIKLGTQMSFLTPQNFKKKRSYISYIYYDYIKNSQQTNRHCVGYVYSKRSNLC